MRGIMSDRFDKFLSSLVFNDQGLIPAIAQDDASGDVLMMAWMNRESIKITFAEGQVCYWSRSRSELWRKGESSGHTQKLVTFRVDCDRDCILLRVDQTGPACHTNRPDCFFTLIDADGSETILTDPIQ